MYAFEAAVVTAIPCWCNYCSYSSSIQLAVVALLVASILDAGDTVALSLPHSTLLCLLVRAVSYIALALTLRALLLQLVASANRC
jgi:hypothetical protein